MNIISQLFSSISIDKLCNSLLYFHPFGFYPKLRPAESYSTDYLALLFTIDDHVTSKQISFDKKMHPIAMASWSDGFPSTKTA
jgi:hypothetical protein